MWDPSVIPCRGQSSNYGDSALNCLPLVRTELNALKII